MATKQVVYRDSRNGRFISKRTAERRPATTEREHVVPRATASRRKSSSFPRGSRNFRAPIPPSARCQRNHV
jgi:hypothetical protein